VADIAEEVDIRDLMKILSKTPQEIE